MDLYGGKGVVIVHLAQGFASLANPVDLGYILLGAFIGILGGGMPGLSTAGVIALALPFTVTMPALRGVVFLIAMYSGSVYGGSITATLLNTPGAPESAVMTYDGYPLTRQGKAGKALWIALIAGTIGGLAGALMLVLVAQPLAAEAIHFGPADYTALALLGLSALTMLTGDPAKALVSSAVGLLLATIGPDPITQVSRFTFGTRALSGGISFIPVLIGLFAISQAMVLIRSDQPILKPPPFRFWSGFPSLKELRRLFKFIILGSGLGVFIGVKPGGGSVVASLISYSTARQVSSRKEEFGHGALEGLATPEAADKATVGAALVPALTLGIPASSTSAILIGALEVHGIQPGPFLFSAHGPLVEGILAGLLIATIAVAGIGVSIVPFVARLVTSFRPRYIGLVMLLLAVLGSFSFENSLLGAKIAICAGVLGYFMRRYRFPLAPLVLTMVIGPILERNMRQAMIDFGGDPVGFIKGPLAVTILIVTVVLVILPPLLRRRSNKKDAREPKVEVLN